MTEQIKEKRTNKLTGADEKKEKRRGWVLLSWLAKFESLAFVWQKTDLEFRLKLKWGMLGVDRLLVTEKWI